MDWDSVSAEPLKLSALSLGDTLLRWYKDPKPVLAPLQDEQFRDEIARLEQDRLPGFSVLSSHLRSSRENIFLYDILRPRAGCTFADIMYKYPDLLPKALSRSPQALKAAAAEWEFFSNLFAEAGLSIPPAPFYLEIQEGLGLVGRIALERLLRQLKRRIQRELNGLWHRLFKRIPSHKCIW